MDSQYAESYKNLYNNHWWWRSRECLLLDVIHEVLEHNKSHKILDFGCGDGLFFDQLSIFGDVYGIENDENIIDPCGIHRSRIHAGDIADAPFEPDSFNLVLACDVIEHIENDFYVLEKLYSLLMLDGILILTVPAFNQLWTSHDEVNFHKRRYRKKELEALAVKAEFTILKSTHVYLSLFFLKLIQRNIEFLSSIFCSSDKNSLIHAATIPGGVVNYIMTQWYVFENKISYRLNPLLGSSLLVVLRK